VKQESEKSEFDKFDAVVRKMMSVPRSELQLREKEWKRKRARLNKKRAKS
jgi:hypothetical protein